MSNTNYPKDIEETERAKAIRHNYDDLFWRQPNVHAVGVGFLIDQEGRRTDQIGVLVSVTEIAPTDQVLPEDRLPDYLDGVPVQILEEAIHQSWSEQILRHRPLMSGIRVTAPAIGSGTNVGTLTGWATRNSDNTKVLVTALHLVTGVDRLHLVSEDEELYQIETTIPAEKVGDILGWVEISDVPGALNAADAAIFRPAGVVQATFEPHIHSTGHIHNSSNFAGLILAGTVDPKPGMDLKYLSPYYGARDVVVERVGDTRSIGDYSYQDVVRLDLGSNLGGLGDSGVACLLPSRR